MNKIYHRSLFVFRRDLRWQDNIALIQALQKSSEVITCFIFTPEQIDNNPFRGNKSLQFLLESLEDLYHALKTKGGHLYFFYGTPHEVISQCVQKLKIDGVFVNKDYTPYSVKRDRSIQECLDIKSIPFETFDDLILHPLHSRLKDDGTPYTVFTPFYKKGLYLNVPAVNLLLDHHYYDKPIEEDLGLGFLQKILPQKDPNPRLKGGRSEAERQLKKSIQLNAYQVTRDFLDQAGSSLLSSYLKYNLLSVREVYHTFKQHFGIDCGLIRSLFWRDFFYQIAFFFPHVFGQPFQKKYQGIVWSENQENFNRWCEGRTGFPIVDAGMRELNETGYMHNRTRMIVASFLKKDIHINWQWGEKYFAQKLVDYDPCLNNGNWQWVASTGCDAQPYFRIFNPWMQQKKFDPETFYIKKWVKELENVPTEIIQDWDKKSSFLFAPLYMSPMLDHAVESKVAVEKYKTTVS